MVGKLQPREQATAALGGAGDASEREHQRGYGGETEIMPENNPIDVLLFPLMSHLYTVIYVCLPFFFYRVYTKHEFIPGAVSVVVVVLFSLCSSAFLYLSGHRASKASVLFCLYLACSLLSEGKYVK